MVKMDSACALELLDSQKTQVQQVAIVNNRPGMWGLKSVVQTVSTCEVDGMTPTFMSTPVIEHVNVDTGSRPWRRVKATFNPRRWGDESSAFFICKIFGARGVCVCVCHGSARRICGRHIFPLCLALSKFRNPTEGHKPSIQWLLYPPYSMILQCVLKMTFSVLAQICLKALYRFWFPLCWREIWPTTQVCV